MLTKAESTNDKPAKETGNKQHNADALKEQPVSRWLRFKKWLFTVTIAELVTVLLTVTIAGTTIYYTIYSKKQWQISRDTLQLSQRAYVTIGKKDGIVASFIPSQDAKQKAQLVIYFQNTGHIPAKLAWGTFGPALIAGGPPGPKSSGITFTHPYKGMVRTRSRKDGSIGEAGESTTVAGDSTFVARLGEIAQDRLIALAAQGEGPLIMGMYRYCDQLRTDATHHFSLG